MSQAWCASKMGSVNLDRVLTPSLGMWEDGRQALKVLSPWNTPRKAVVGAAVCVEALLPMNPRDRRNDVTMTSCSSRAPLMLITAASAAGKNFWEKGVKKVTLSNRSRHGECQAAGRWRRVPRGLNRFSSRCLTVKCAAAHVFPLFHLLYWGRHRLQLFKKYLSRLLWERTEEVLSAQTQNSDGFLCKGEDH